MLYSQFFVNEDRYVLPIRDIVKIAPYVALKPIPLLPDYIAGLMNYHGCVIPVVDVCQLLVSRPSRKILSTRIIIVELKDDNGMWMSLGLVVEKSTEVIMVEEHLFDRSPVNNPESLIIGPVAIVNGYLITKISVQAIFDKVDSKLFSGTEAQVITK